MTVAPEDLMTLVCDTCGDTITGAGSLLPDTEVVWTLISENGWTGSPIPTGPHRCPRCGLFPAIADAGAGGESRRRSGTVSGIDCLTDVTIVTLVGDIDIDACGPLRSALHTAIAVNGYVILDLTEVHLIDSTALGLLVRAQHEARRRGGVLGLAAPSRFILSVLHTMHLADLFPIFTSCTEATAELAPGWQPRQWPAPHPIFVDADDNGASHDGR